MSLSRAFGIIFYKNKQVPNIDIPAAKSILRVGRSPKNSQATIMVKRMLPPVTIGYTTVAGKKDALYNCNIYAIPVINADEKTKIESTIREERLHSPLSFFPLPRNPSKIGPHSRGLESEVNMTYPMGETVFGEIARTFPNR